MTGRPGGVRSWLARRGAARPWRCSRSRWPCSVGNVNRPWHWPCPSSTMVNPARAAARRSSASSSRCSSDSATSGATTSRIRRPSRRSRRASWWAAAPSRWSRARTAMSRPRSAGSCSTACTITPAWSGSSRPSRSRSATGRCRASSRSRASASTLPASPRVSRVRWAHQVTVLRAPAGSPSRRRSASTATSPSVDVTLPVMAVRPSSNRTTSPSGSVDSGTDARAVSASSRAASAWATAGEGPAWQPGARQPPRSSSVRIITPLSRRARMGEGHLSAGAVSQCPTQRACERRIRGPGSEPVSVECWFEPVFEDTVAHRHRQPSPGSLWTGSPSAPAESAHRVVAADVRRSCESLSCTSGCG